MSDRPVFLYAAIYDEIADAEADYEAVFELHALGAIGTFDSAVIRKEHDGKVRVRGGISRGDLKELGDELEAGNAAVIVIGESKIEEQLEKAVTRANKLIEKQIDADAEELRREIDAAARAGAA
jgi:uncharacterized membrane protein